MDNYSRERILQIVEEEDVEFIRLQFTDMFGMLKNIAITSRELTRALDDQCVVDGSLIAGIAAGKEADLYLHPDPDSFTILPWRPQQGKVARLLCDIYCADGTPYQTSCRYLLKQITGKAEADGYTCSVDPECEFFLFHTDDNGKPTTLTHEQAGYLDISPLDLGENARRDMILAMEDMGLEIESSHHETAPAQHEIDLRPAEIRKAADQIMTFKMAVRTIAKRHGLHATFMPKPRAEVDGSGMHLNFVLYKDGKNLFENTQKPGEYSEEAYCFIGGLLAHSKEMMLITNPLVNSYKRLVPGFEAPTELNYSTSDLSSIIRLPYKRSGEMVVELKSPDASSNPYLVFAVCLAAGLDGIRKKIRPVKIDKAAGEIPDHLPQTLKEAIDAFEGSGWIRETLGAEFCRKYLCAKKQEWESYSRQVSAWELEHYLYRV